MRFADICHQDRAVSIIRRALASGRSHHAYLFDGPEGVGKESAAMALTGRMLCEAGDLAADADACGACPRLHADHGPTIDVLIPICAHLQPVK